MMRSTSHAYPHNRAPVINDAAFPRPSLNPSRSARDPHPIVVMITMMTTMTSSTRPNHRLMIRHPPRKSAPGSPGRHKEWILPLSHRMIDPLTVNGRHGGRDR